MGRAIGEQCRRMGIQVNYAPVVDVNNNPNNPVIGYRSFGEDKYKVGLLGTQIMKGMQDAGIMACAKHFPGHGDTETDSHYDLPIISKNRSQLDSMELYPFRELFKNKVGSVMIAHLYIPSIDNTANRATSLSPNNVTQLLRTEMGYEGISFTDALEMKGVAKFFPGGEASVQSLIAGNDMLCLPSDVADAIKRVRKAIKKKKLKWDDIYAKTKKVLLAKYQLGLHQWQPINTNNLVNDLNAKTASVRRRIFESGHTLLKNDKKGLFPLQKLTTEKLAYIAIGVNSDNVMTRKMRSEYNADVFFFDYKQSGGRVPSLVNLIKNRYQKVVIGLHNYSRRPASNFGISADAHLFINELTAQTNSLVCAFGNPYAVKNFCNASNIFVGYEDDEISQETAFNMIKGDLSPHGKLPVTVCENFTFGSGLAVEPTKPMLFAEPRTVGLNEKKLAIIDSIVNEAITQGAAPGCVVLVAKDGLITFEKAYGHTTYEKTMPVKTDHIFDMASVTKICATTISVMKLYDEKKLKLDGRLGDYLPWVKGSNKENLTIKNILLHQAGLKAWIPFYRETIDVAGKPIPAIYAGQNDGNNYNVRVAENLYMKKDWIDTMYKRILESPLEAPNKYIYSDNDFIFLGKIVEALSGRPLEQYVNENFYTPMRLSATGFKPRERFSAGEIIPTENEKTFRLQTLQGDVHDPGAAMFGGVAGHAGLFATAEDLAVIMQMLINGGNWGGVQYLKDETVKLFTSYQSDISRRGFGFDKPEKDNTTRKEPYPCLSASPATFGHTGFTGTCAWADPEKKLVFIFLSNRVHPMGGDNAKLLRMNVRGNIQEAVYKAMVNGE
jgi:beta-N-acetylhexosaminidase